jgi:hypothetical protein
MKRPASETLDVSSWPSININALEENARDRYQQRATAVELYASGVPIGDIEEKTQLDRRVLYRMIERALQPHPDGRPWGFRALVPGSHTKTYQRCKASTSKRVGLAGAFNQLLEEYPKLEQLVRQLIVNRDILLVQKGDHVYLKNLRNAHNRFTAACRSIGLTANDYPLNQEQKGRISFGSTLRYRMMQDFKDAHRSAGGDRLKPASALAERHAAPITEPFDTVEFDAHRLDLRLKILDQDPYGEEQLIEIERVWLLALIDVCTRAILGYTLCLRREYSRYDVIRTFEKALSPASMRPILIMPIPKIREEHLAEARRLNGLDAKRDAIELDEKGAVIDDLEQRRRRWRRWCGLSKIIVMRSPEERVPIHRKMARPASLDNCENLIEMLLRRKRLSLPARARVDSQRLLELTYPATLPTTASSSHAVTWLLWEASWRVMSTGLQVGRQPLHVQTLTVKWWTSAPEPLRIGPSEYLLRALSGCATNLDLFWQSVVERMKRYGFYFVDLRLVSIEFRGTPGAIRWQRNSNGR